MGRKMGWAQALETRGQSDGLGGAKGTSSWQQLKKNPRVSFQALWGNQLVLQGVQGKLGWPGISLRPPCLVYLDHPLVLILFVAFHVHLERRLGVGGEGPRPPTSPSPRSWP